MEILIKREFKGNNKKPLVYLQAISFGMKKIQ